MNSGNCMSKKLKNKACGTPTIVEKDSVTNESNGQVDFEPISKNTNNLGPVCDKEKEERIDYIQEATSANPKKDSAPGNEKPPKNASSSKSQMNSGNCMSKKLKNKACGTPTIVEKDSVTNESNGQVDFEPISKNTNNLGPVCDKEKEERIDYIKEAASANPYESNGQVDLE